jgi:hypothetical protein
MMFSESYEKKSSKTFEQINVLILVVMDDVPWNISCVKMSMVKVLIPLL